MPTQQDIYDHMQRRIRRLDCAFIGEATEAILVLDASYRWPLIQRSDLAPIAGDVCRAVKDQRADKHGDGDEWMSDDERDSFADDAGLDSAGGEL